MTSVHAEPGDFEPWSGDQVRVTFAIRADKVRAMG
jgi:hypothetical protein